jgi:Piwi domain
LTYADIQNLKINSKLGGVSHRPQPSGVPTSGGDRGNFLARINTMIVGADVTHPKEGLEQNCPSIAGVVATDEANSSRYLGSARLQKAKQEVNASTAVLIFSDHILENFRSGGNDEGACSGLVQ